MLKKMQPLRQVVRSFEDAAECVALAWRASGDKVLRLDGFMGVGKSSIASLLASNLKTAVIEADNFATPDAKSNAITDRIDQAKLWDAATLALTQFNRTIFDGVCLEELLPSAQFGAGFRVYIKRISGSGLWNDGLEIGAAEPSSNWLDEAILRYHRAWRPHERCHRCLAIPEEVYA